MTYKKIKYFILLISIFTIGINAFGQADLSSPYSRFGLGDLFVGSPNTKLKGMGGISNAISNSTILSPNNPASFAAIDTLSILFDAGFYIKTASFSTTSMTESGSNASFEYANIGLSATKWWKLGVGVTPYSNKEYNVITNHNDLGSYNVSFQGEGGITKVYIANGFKIGKNLSLGLTASYLFGKLSDITSVYYPDSVFFINGRRSIDTRVSDFKFDYGFIYSIPINSYKLNIGATYSQNTNLSSKRDLFIRNMFKGFEGQSENPIDTLAFEQDEKVEISIPDGFGVGFTLEKNNRWLLGADFNWSGWKGFSMNGVNDSLQNAWNIAIGGSYKPASTSISSYFKKITYRAGFHYDQTYYNVYGTSINKYGVTLGLGLPVQRSLTTFNVAVEFGALGTTNNNLVKESYFNISISMSIYDRWFIKKKYK